MNTFFLIFIGLPALEIFLMIKIGGEIGALKYTSSNFSYSSYWCLFRETTGNSDYKVRND